MLLRLAYLAVTNTFALLRLLPMSDRDKDIEILALRHRLLVLQRQVGRPVFTDTDRVVLAGLLHRLPRQRLCQLLLLVRPDTVLRWHRDLIKRRHAATLRAEAARTPAHGPLDPRPGPAPGPREPLMGVPAESTQSSPPWASRSPPRPSGKSCGSTALRPRRNGGARPGPTSCAARRTRCWPATSSRPAR